MSSLDKFRSVAMNEENRKWKYSIKRNHPLYKKNDDLRSEFYRDYTRILHSYAYRRLKHKTQVFFATRNDHVCTRMEHVNHVMSIGETIAKGLGLNTDLTRAIALGHDLGHPPFGHEGELLLSGLLKEKAGAVFWHEKNSLHVVDDIETLLSPDGSQKHLDLTYAVRDGIICHCGEVDEKSLIPRDDAVELSIIRKGFQPMPYTWEGCVVKIADKISYLGRDMEDAVSLGIVSHYQLMKEYRDMVKKYHGKDYSFKSINNTGIIHELIQDLLSNSFPDKGLQFSQGTFLMLNELKRKNYEFIYRSHELEYFRKYAGLIMESLFDFLHTAYNGRKTIDLLRSKSRRAPGLVPVFIRWLKKYTNIDLDYRNRKNVQSRILYSIDKEEEYIFCLVDFLASMSDFFAIESFQELIRF